MISSVLTDTMNDLIVDTIGATIGALYGVWLIKREQHRESKRLPKLTEEIAQRGVKS